ncbi:hypothetical protein DFA_00207 [Cavenderia fasciculata]|uniref:Uncharacterized protein n=1 Tax=Cavenderia fasciculata TaxID=261658 RepID=F4PXW9_CACFS|nr:uncharacterized protein DFA_00207 [Cavenderia fasciculata]EGG19629.1 hypothetical protein DFA_00207 [Cavenderia fasciculata]|eukprot:XP_004357923.1 hypothetical protein DFA_00207 [Cavenderia fasciculata]
MTVEHLFGPYEPGKYTFGQHSQNSIFFEFKIEILKQHNLI